MEKTIDKEYEVIPRPEALSMLHEHADFLAQVSLPAAERLEDMFYQKINSLSFWPERYRWLENPAIPRHKYRRLPFEKNYMIVYRVTEDTVYIDFVLDARMDYARFLVP
ncbi:MAG: type II toxin-antitoxin system RelE/ParE family toxin [Spirochaetaceae bacterium]|jgi:plasmid stabilization system protein ParE|nr:type II toxin-antitoxin system RelE/ParE family toxin [Spirochaetaceae bacterium]MDR0910602.1 type II toxin-antitoxin system RelE/ParE family toxin [Spirochaetaceae bacterium]